MPADHVQLLCFWSSTFSMRVRIALKEKGVHFEAVDEDILNKSQLLLSLNPIHKTVPVLIHNGKVVCESLVIVQYIDETWLSEEKCLLPKDPYQRAVARFWADYIDNKVVDAARRIMKSPKGELQEQATKDLIDRFVTLDSAFRDVAGEKPYFGGDSIGLVDIAFAPLICWSKAYEVVGDFKLPDEKQCPHLHAWVKRLVEYPNVKEAMRLTPSDKVVEFLHFRRKSVWRVA